MKLDKYPKNWKEITEKVKDRDKYQCQHCGCVEGEMRLSRRGKIYIAVMQVAHLDHDPENHNVSLDRLLTLCQPCHLKNDREALRGKIFGGRTINKNKENKKELAKSKDAYIAKLEKEVKMFMAINSRLSAQITHLEKELKIFRKTVK